MRFAIFAVLALALASCANRKNPYYCDEESDCCTCAASPSVMSTRSCQNQTSQHLRRATSGEQCNRAQVCTSVARPHCSDESEGAMGVCECTLNAHCEGDCDTESQTCLPPIIPCSPGDTGDSDCASANADKPYCAAMDTCAECALSVHCEEAVASVCDPEAFNCRACLDHPECSSLFCELDNDGLCADPATVIYVDAVGTGALCTLAEPCSSFATAIGLVTSTRNRIVVAEGSYNQQIILNNLKVEIVGIGSAVIAPSLGTGESALTVTGSSEVAVTNMEFRPTAAASATDVIHCDGAAASLSLEKVGVFESRDLGVLATDCNLQINASKIIDNDGGGITVTGGGSYSITNNIIAHNISASSNAAVNISSNGSQQRFDFNTVVGNQSGGATAGVACSTVPALQASGNIIYGNSVGDAISGNCQWKFSDIEGIAATNDNIDLDPQLVNNSAFGDYHLRSTSPCIDAADSSVILTTDIDGEVRPQGAAPDIGADESQ